MADTGQSTFDSRDRLDVQVHRTGMLGTFRRRIAADCLHFSVSRIQVETYARFRVGQPVVMDVTVNDLRVEELTGVVRSVSAVEGKHYYDIDFREDGATRANAARCLRHIETRAPQTLNLAG
jgi:hypothetical protein